LIVTVTVPSPLGSTMTGPARTVVACLPFAGFVYVTLKLTACVTTLPSENVVCRSAPTVWNVNGNGHRFGPAGIVPVRSRLSSVVTGWSAAATGATNSASAAVSTKAFSFIVPPRQLYERLRH
jgi:hypothetical protein